MKKLDQIRLSHAIQRKMVVDGLTTRPAAEIIGVSKATLNRLVNCKFMPDVNTYYLVCQWLGRGMEFYFTKNKVK